jgi:hypothetical protein
MTMLAHTGASFKPAPGSWGTRNEAGVANTPLAKIRRFCLLLLTVLLAGSALVGIIALKAAIYYDRFLS